MFHLLHACHVVLRDGRVVCARKCEVLLERTIKLDDCGVFVCYCVCRDHPAVDAAYHTTCFRFSVHVRRASYGDNHLPRNCMLPQAPLGGSYRALSAPTLR